MLWSVATYDRLSANISRAVNRTGLFSSLNVCYYEFDRFKLDQLDQSTLTIKNEHKFSKKKNELSHVIRADSGQGPKGFYMESYYVPGLG